MVDHRCAVCGQVYDTGETDDVPVTVDGEQQDRYRLHRSCAREAFKDWYEPREGLGEIPEQEVVCDRCGEVAGFGASYHPDTSGEWLCRECHPKSEV